MKTHRLRRVWPWAVSLGLLGCGAEPGTRDFATLATPAQQEGLGQEEGLGNEERGTAAPAFAPLSRTDRGYLLAVAASHSYQGQMSNLVATHTHNPDTRDFGRFVVETNEDVRHRMLAFAQRYRTALPAILSHKQSHRLHKLSCCVWFFEKTYFKYMYKELAILRKQSNDALTYSRNPDVRAWARDTLDTIDLTLRLSAAGNAVFEFVNDSGSDTRAEALDVAEDDDDASDLE